MKDRKPTFAGVAGKVFDCACRIVLECDSGRVTLDDALDGVPTEFRRTVEHLLFTFFRQRRIVENILKQFIKKSPAPEVMILLALAAVQTRFQHGIAPESAVNVAVDAAKKFHADKFVNALLRNFLRTEFPAGSSPADILPPAIFQRWKKRFDKETLKELAGLFTAEPIFTYRILPGFQPVAESVPVQSFGETCFASAPASAVLNSETLTQGGFYIQDPATAFAVSLAADDAPRARCVLDLCAAPGGKTLMLGELCSPECNITAADINRRRQERTRKNFELYQRNYQVITAAPEKITGKFDIIMADMPCSNTGVFRKRPDALWRFSEKHLREIVQIQHHILESAVKLLAPNGIIIVSTCSIEPEENSLLVDFLTSLNPALHCEIQQTILPSASHDGAFAARVRLAG